MTSTELGYLSGVTSNIQDQLNGKVDSVGSYIQSISDIDNLMSSGWYRYNCMGSSVTVNGKTFAFNFAVIRVDAYSSFIFQTLYPAHTSVALYRFYTGTYSNWMFDTHGYVGFIDYGDSTEEYKHDKYKGCLMFVKST